MSDDPAHKTTSGEDRMSSCDLGLWYRFLSWLPRRRWRVVHLGVEVGRYWTKRGAQRALARLPAPPEWSSEPRDGVGKRLYPDGTFG